MGSTRLNSISPLLSKLDGNLSILLQGIDVQAYSRIDESRLITTALAHIGYIELVSADAFDNFYDAMYISMFSKTGERERSDLITDRLQKEFAGERTGLAPYRIVGIRSHDGTAIGAAHFSVLMLKDEKHAVPYLQYIYVRKENRRQDMAEVLHTMILAVASADAAKDNGRTVPFTLFETEPAGYGDDEAARKVATQRIQIHSKAGAVGVMLKRQEAEDAVVLVSPHCQPGLEVGEPPLSLLWAIRKSPAASSDIGIGQVGQSIVAAYYQSLRDEGFPEQNIRLAERIVAERCKGCEYISMPLSEVILPTNTHGHP